MSEAFLENLLKLVDLDRLIHEPARHLLMAYLYVVEEADFVYLIRQTGLSGGNVSSHMNKLEQAGYIEVQKTFLGKRPQTIFKLTKKGRAAFLAYRNTMIEVLNLNSSDSNPSLKSTRSGR